MADTKPEAMSGGTTTPDLAGPEIIQALSRVLPRHVRADEALSAVLCALTQRLTRGEAIHVLVNLPASVRTFFAECVLEREEPADTFELSELFERVATHLGIPVEEAELIAREAISLVQPRLSREVFEHVAAQLPADIELMWREVAGSARAMPAQGP